MIPWFMIINIHYELPFLPSSYTQMFLITTSAFDTILNQACDTSALLYSNEWSHSCLPLCFTVIHGAFWARPWAEKRNCRQRGYLCKATGTYPIQYGRSPREYSLKEKKVMPSTTILYQSASYQHLECQLQKL